MSASVARGETLTVNAERTIVLNGAVDPQHAEGITAAFLLFTLQNHEPIDLFINSPGGRLDAGYRIINAIEFAKRSGVKVRCTNVGQAMSMAFQIYLHCSERYALPPSEALFHYPKTAPGPSTSEDLLVISRELAQAEAAFVDEIAKALNVDAGIIRVHCQLETVWSPAELNKLSPGFVTVVDTIQGTQADTLL